MKLRNLLAATVTGIGNDPYGLAVVDVDKRHHDHGSGHDRD
jgi:hypothetical protein